MRVYSVGCSKQWLLTQFASYAWFSSGAPPKYQPFSYFFLFFLLKSEDFYCIFVCEWNHVIKQSEAVPYVKLLTRRGGNFRVRCLALQPGLLGHGFRTITLLQSQTHLRLQLALKATALMPVWVPSGKSAFLRQVKSMPIRFTQYSTLTAGVNVYRCLSLCVNSVMGWWPASAWIGSYSQ